MLKMDIYHDRFNQLVMAIKEQMRQVQIMDDRVANLEEALMNLSDAVVDAEAAGNQLKVLNKNVDNIFYSVLIIVAVLAFLITFITSGGLIKLRKSADIISQSIKSVATASSQSSNAISTVSDGSRQQADSISQAVTAVENRETAREEWCKEIALWRVALAFGFVFDVDDLIAAVTH